MAVRSYRFGASSLLFAFCLSACGSSAPDPTGIQSPGGGTGGTAAGTGGTAAGTGGTPAGTDTGGTPSDTGGAPPATGGAHIGGPTTPVSGGDSVPAELTQALTAASEQSGASLQASHPVELEQSLGYDPSTASGLELIQASPLALTASQLGKLHDNGLVIAKDRTFPSFVYGYKSIYAADLPVYVSADSVLYAMHHSYDKVLESVEGGDKIGQHTVQA